MFKLTGGGSAEVFRASIDRSPSGRECLLATVQFAQRRFEDGTLYRQRIRVISYQRDVIEAVERMRPGSMVSFGGEIDAYNEIGAGGRMYANPRLIGSIFVHD